MELNTDDNIHCAKKTAAPLVLVLQRHCHFYYFDEVVGLDLVDKIKIKYVVKVSPVKNTCITTPSAFLVLPRMTIAHSPVRHVRKTHSPAIRYAHSSSAPPVRLILIAAT